LEEDDLEEEYDALNDETFGPDATISDWEKDHEKLAEITESNRPHNQNTTNKKVCYVFQTLFSLIYITKIMKHLCIHVSCNDRYNQYNLDLAK